MNRFSSFVSILFIALIVNSANALIIGEAETGVGNCYPFGCDESLWEPYQQVYGATAFSESVVITSLTFYNTYGPAVNLPTTGIYAFELSTTTAVVDGLSSRSNYTDNYGPDNLNVFTGSINTPSLSGGGFDVFLQTPFSYNPSFGNLLLTVTVENLGTPTGIGFDVDWDDDDELSRNWGPDTYGLVTGFNEASAPIPEPTTILLFGSGLAGLIGSRIRRKK